MVFKTSIILIVFSIWRPNLISLLSKIIKAEQPMKLCRSIFREQQYDLSRNIMYNRAWEQEREKKYSNKHFYLDDP